MYERACFGEIHDSTITTNGVTCVKDPSIFKVPKRSQVHCHNNCKENRKGRDRTSWIQSFTMSAGFGIRREVAYILNLKDLYYNYTCIIMQV